MKPDREASGLVTHQVHSLLVFDSSQWANSISTSRLFTGRGMCPLPVPMGNLTSVLLHMANCGACLKVPVNLGQALTFPMWRHAGILKNVVNTLYECPKYMFCNTFGVCIQ